MIDLERLDVAGFDLNWLRPGGFVPVDATTMAILVAEVCHLRAPIPDIVREIARLRDENVNLAAACKIADRKNEALHDLLTAASGAHEFLSGNSFSNPAEATEADIHRERLEQAIEQAKARMKCP